FLFISIFKINRRLNSLLKPLVWRSLSTIAPLKTPTFRGETALQKNYRTAKMHKKFDHNYIALCCTPDCLRQRKNVRNKNKSHFLYSQTRNYRPATVYCSSPYGALFRRYATKNVTYAPAPRRANGHLPPLSKT